MLTIAPPPFAVGRTHAFLRLKSPDKWWCSHFQFFGVPTTYPPTAMIAGFEAAVVPVVRACLTAGTEVYSTQLFSPSLSHPGTMSSFEHVVGLAGTVAGDQLPSLSTACVLRAAILGDRRFYSRLLVSGVPDAFTSGSRINTTGLTAYTALGAATVGNFTAGGLTASFCVKSIHSLAAIHLSQFRVRATLCSMHRRRDRGSRGKFFPVFPNTP